MIGVAASSRLERWLPSGGRVVLAFERLRERLGELLDPALLHLDDPLEVGDPLLARAVVVGFEVGAAGVVAQAACGMEVLSRPEQVRMRARGVSVVDRVGGAAAAWPWIWQR
jgi:hypothetical protein